MLELDMCKNKRVLQILYGQKKTMKKKLLIELAETIIFNFIDLMRSKSIGSSEIDKNNYELEVIYESLPYHHHEEKELFLNINGQFYQNQKIAHHQKQIAMIETNFNKFKSAYLKKSAINKNEVNLKL
jgi:hypothetical protein